MALAGGVVAQQRQVRAAVLVQIGDGEAGAVGGEQHSTGPVPEGIDVEHGDAAVQLPGDDELREAVAVQIGVFHPAYGAALSGNGDGRDVARLVLPVHAELQRSLGGAEKGQSLQLSAAVKVVELHGLAVGAPEGGGKLAAPDDLPVDEGLEADVFRGELRQRVELRHRHRRATAQQEKQREQHRDAPHGRRLPSRNRLGHNKIFYYSTLFFKMIVLFSTRSPPAEAARRLTNPTGKAILKAAESSRAVSHVKTAGVSGRR